MLGFYSNHWKDSEKMKHDLVQDFKDDYLESEKRNEMRIMTVITQKYDKPKIFIRL